MKLRLSSVPMMLEYMSKLNAASADEAFLNELCNHEDYRFEMRRYGLSSSETLISYFSRLNTIAEDDIPELCDERKSALRDKHDLWLDCLNNPQKYCDRYENVKRILCGENIRDLQNRLRAAFPDNIAIDDASIVSTLSFGPSFGYVYENALHFDLFGIENYCSIEELPYTILHEMHHLQVQKLIGNYDSFTGKFTLLENYIFRFSGEGLAIKFCNNAEGVVSKRIDHRMEENIGLPAMPVLNRHFDEHLKLFCNTVKGIKLGSITEKEMNEQFESYWWNPYLYKDEAESLAQTPIYSFGNELFGSIFDAFGRKAMFECFYSPIKTFDYLNKTAFGQYCTELPSP